jgi:hypothetical protein
MSTPAFGFDFSQMNPYITGIMDRSLRAMDYNLEQQPRRDSMNDRAYAEWLTNNASKRGIAEDDARMRRTGFDASQALAGRMEKRGVDAADEAGPAGLARRYQRFRNMRSTTGYGGASSIYGQQMADSNARSMVYGGPSGIASR